MPAEFKTTSCLRLLRRVARGLGQCWLALSLLAGGLAGPAAAGHDLLHEHEAGHGHAGLAHLHHEHGAHDPGAHDPGAHDHDASADAASAQADEACQPDPLCMAGCAHAGSALPPLRLPALSLLRPPAAAGPGPDSFRSRAPERELRPPIPTLDT